jgi:hypothetical protein
VGVFAAVVVAHNRMRGAKASAAVIGGGQRSVVLVVSRAVAAALVAMVALTSAFPADAGTARDRKQRSFFMQTHPCPANGRIRGKCPGYVIDHIRPLCAGGADRWSNMQWQTIEQAKVKDREERKLCAQQRQK